MPSSVRARVWASLLPHATCTTRWPARVLTHLGRSCVTLSPWPSRPYSPQPQVYSSPLEVMAALWELPHAMSRTLLFFSASISRGLSMDILEQWPSLPSSPSPQLNTLPSTVSAMACLPPLCTATFLTTYWLRELSCRGTGTLLQWPRPSRPLVPSPQAYTLPSLVTRNRDLDPPAMDTGFREERTSEKTGSLIFEPFSPPS